MLVQLNQCLVSIYYVLELMLRNIEKILKWSMLYLCSICICISIKYLNVYKIGVHKFLWFDMQV